MWLTPTYVITYYEMEIFTYTSNPYLVGIFVEGNITPALFIKMSIF